jgi:hypothetical protein
MEETTRKNAAMEEMWGTAKSNSQHWKRPADVKKSYNGHTPKFSERLDTLHPNYRGIDEPHPLEVCILSFYAPPPPSHDSRTCALPLPFVLS